MSRIACRWPERVRAWNSSPRPLGRLYELSGGNPRLINVLADGALEQGFPRKAKTITRSLLEAAARELDLIPPSPASTLRQDGHLRDVPAAFLLVGAAGGAYVYRSEVAAFIRQWQAEPVAPAPPRPDCALGPPAHSIAGGRAIKGILSGDPVPSLSRSGQ